MSYNPTSCPVVSMVRTDQDWRILSQADFFWRVLNSFGVFCAVLDSNEPLRVNRFQVKSKLVNLGQFVTEKDSM